MRMDRITDAADPRLADFLGLRDGDRRFMRPPPAGARRTPVYAAEGRLIAERALAAGHVPVAFLVDERRAGDVPAGLPDGVPVLLAAESLVREVTGLGVVRELLGLFERPPARAPGDVLEGAHRVMVLEGVANPVNLGVLVRTAAALGIDATLLDPASSDPLYRRAVRGSMGAVLTHPIARTAALPEGLAPLRERGFRVLALTPARDAVPLEEAVPGPGERVALLLGAEGHGLSDAAIAAADARVVSPRAGGVDSLNVAAAAAVACHRLGRVS
ncbi:MAG: RNA methyltransferase [Thermoleophilia bacterium]|nr:RNA methyltransferase [Thermoleophilia bacterium]